MGVYCNDFQIRDHLFKFEVFFFLISKMDFRKMKFGKVIATRENVWVGKVEFALK